MIIKESNKTRNGVANLKKLTQPPNHLFCVGFETLGGAFLKLAPTVFSTSFISPPGFFTIFTETEAADIRNLLEWLISLISCGTKEREHVTKTMRASVKREAKALVPISMAVSAPRQREQCSFRVLEEQRVKDELIEERGCICKLNAFQAKPTCSKPSAILRKGKQEPMSLQSTVYRNITAYIGDQNTFRFDRLLVSLTVVQSLNFY